MVGVQDEQAVQSANHRRINIKGLVGQPETHADKVLGQVPRRVRVQLRQAGGALRDGCDHDGELGQQLNRGFFKLFRFEGVQSVLVVGRQTGNARLQD